MNYVKPLLLYSLALAPSMPASSPQSPITVVDDEVIYSFDDHGNHVTKLTVEELRYLDPGTNREFHAIRVLEIENLVSGATFSLEDSPIWRLDFRKLSDLVGAGSTPDHAEWKLVPSLEPDENFPSALNFESTLPWIETTSPRTSSVSINSISDSYVVLRWDDVLLSDWYSNRSAEFDVVVHLRFPASCKPLDASIEVLVEKDNPTPDVVLLSVAFPDFYLPPLDQFSEEPGSGVPPNSDDILLSPFEHGFLVSDPIRTLDDRSYSSGFGVGEAWPRDTYHSDFSAAVTESSFPGEVSMQFMAYYDIETVDAAEAWTILNTAQTEIVGYGKRLSLRGGGPLLYLGAHDPDSGFKRFVTESAKLESDDDDKDRALRLAIRTLIDFDANRMHLFRNGPAPTYWQTYGQGPDIGTLSKNTEDSEFSWPMAIQFSPDADWLDAAMYYREFFVEESNALIRNGSNVAIKFQELPETGSVAVPGSYKELVGTIGLAEFTDHAATSLSNLDIPVTSHTIQLQEYIDWLRDSWSQYAPSGADEPYVAVIHGEGMYKVDNVTPGGPYYFAVKSAGNAESNTDMRSGLGELYNNLRTPTTTPNWPARVLTGVNRDTGSIDASTLSGVPYTASDDIVAFRETGKNSTTPSGSSDFTSYSRYVLSNGSIPSPFEVPEVENGRSLLQDSLDTFRYPTATDPPQLDWYWISGQGSAAKPDYSAWKWWSTASSGGLGTGGGGRWTSQFREMLEDFVNTGLHSDQSPDLFFSTERLNDMTLCWNGPRGHRRTYPVARVDSAGSNFRNLVVYGEPLVLTSYMYHDYALMVGDASSFAKYYAKPYQNVLGDCGALINRSARSDEYLDQISGADRTRGVLQSAYNLGVLVLDAGCVPSMVVEVSGAVNYECDPNSAGGSSPDEDGDRLTTTFSGNIAVGEDDLAKSNSNNTCQEAFRELLRARSQMRQFLIGGQRLRDPQMEDPSSQGDWWADDMKIIRWRNPNLGSSNPKAAGINTGSPGGDRIALNTLVLGTYGVDDTTMLSDNRRVMVSVFHSMIDYGTHDDDDLEYRLVIDTDKWPEDVLEPTEDYDVALYDLELNQIKSAGTIARGDQVSLEALGTDSIEPGEVHFWVFTQQ